MENDKGTPFSDRELIFTIAELRQDIKALSIHLENVNEKLHKLETDQSDIKEQINRWKGALPVIIAIGGIAAFLLTILDKIKNFFI